MNWLIQLQTNDFVINEFFALNICKYMNFRDFLTIFADQLSTLLVLFYYFSRTKEQIIISIDLKLTISGEQILKKLLFSGFFIFLNKRF